MKEIKAKGTADANEFTEQFTKKAGALDSKFATVARILGQMVGNKHVDREEAGKLVGKMGAYELEYNRIMKGGIGHGYIDDQNAPKRKKKHS